MPIETDLSVSPYFDEAAAGLEKNYYKILFKPSVPVQVRELNELQTILQNQIEEFGDSVLKKGTIVRGCTFSFFNNYPFIKIKDSQVDGAPVNISAFKDKMITSGSGQSAIVLDYIDGFETTDPDTKSLYLRYINSGSLAGNTKFQANDVLMVQDPNYSISNVIITSAGSGYSNTDTVTFVSAIGISDLQGTLVVGATMTQPTSGANAVIVAVDTSTYPNKTIVKIRPVTGDFTDSTKTANAWSFAAGDSIISLANSSVTATVNEIIGSGAAAVLTTDSTQRISDVSMTNGGAGYYVSPYAAARSTAGGSGAAMTAQNFYCQIIVYNGFNSVGLGYGFGVSEGIVYQKGYFLNVPEQTVVVSKYNKYPNNVSVGFSTLEDIIDAYEDTTLLDNALGTRNYTAPGADRLKLTPILQVANTDEAQANLEFFSIVEFADGVPYKQNQRTVYSGINDEMAIRTFDSSGDFVTDQFLLACKSVSNSSLRANSFSIVVDPGTAYIDGYRVNTYGNYQFTLDKGTDTEVKESANVSLNYGSYVIVNNLAGSFDFSAVGTVKLYDVAASYLGNSSVTPYSSATIAAPAGGTQIGTAKVRSINYADSASTGYPQGSPDSKYNMYIFDIQMTPGKSFKDVKSIFYDSTVKGIADVVLDQITTAGAGTDLVLGAVLKNTISSDKKNLDKMIFYSGFDSPLAINTISYQYRTFDDSGTTYILGNNGIIEVTLTGNEYFPYNTDLTDTQKQQLVFMPLQHVYTNAAAGGAGNAVINSTNVISSGNVSFTTTLRVGDYIRLSSNASAGQEIRRITNVTNATHLSIDRAASFSNSVATVTKTFPAYVPLPILTREGVTATASVGAQLLTINLGTRLFGSSNTIPLAAAFNISVANAQVAAKSANRNLFVKVFPGNNSTGFGYSEFGTGVNGYFTSSSNVISNTSTSQFTAGQTVKIIKDNADFVSTVGTVVNSTQMQLSSAVNFTGNADIYAAINLNGPWCLGVPDIFRLKNVYLANTSAVNATSTNVTRDFVIDHNHNPNYIDLGYLVKKKESSLVIGPNDYLLVQFDAFTRNYENRPVHVNSYVSSNAATRANVDAKSLSELNNSYINTFELPEIYSSSGSYYDTISHIDFRPTVANTANLATTVAGATLNPAYTVTFSGTNKKFPVPDSNMSFTTEYFLGRIDTVYVGADGRIGTARGHSYPSTILNSTNPDGLLTPISNENTMILNHIKIPAYPSIEENAAASLSGVIDKSVINEINLSKRYSARLISRLLTKQDIEFEQPRQYSMEDIGSLERRIRDLEYYVALSNLELSTKDLNLPSSISKNINRFKFGFFADAFDDTTYTDVDSVEYAASIEDNRVIPSYELVKIEIPGGECPYTDFSVVNQSKATGPDLPICVSKEALQVTQGSTNLGVKWPNNKVTQKAVYVNMASSLGNNSGQVTIYMNFYGKADVMRIYQSTVANSFPSSPVLTTKDSVPLNAIDKTYMKGLPDGFFLVKNPNTQSPIWLDKFQLVNSPANGLRFAGKIVFNHNPANGRYYKIETDRHSFFYRYRIEYPINVSCPGSIATTGNTVGGGTTTTGSGSTGSANYNGTIKLLGVKDVKVSNDSLKTTFYRVHFSVSGLKPNTKHKLFFSKADMSHLCDTSVRDTVVPVAPNFSTTADLTWQEYASQVPDFFGDSPNGYIMTDAGGRIEAFLYMLSDETLDIKSKASKKPAKKKNQKKPTDPEVLYDIIQKPVIEIYNDDKSSYAHKVSDFKYKLFSGFRKS